MLDPERRKRYADKQQRDKIKKKKLYQDNPDLLLKHKEYGRIASQKAKEKRLAMGLDYVKE